MLSIISHVGSLPQCCAREVCRELSLLLFSRHLRFESNEEAETEVLLLCCPVSLPRMENCTEGIFKTRKWHCCNDNTTVVSP